MYYVQPRTLGQTDSSLTDPTTAGLMGIVESPFVWIGLGLLIVFLQMGPVKRKRSRKKHPVSPLSTAVLALGAGAGGYLLGKYSGL